MRHLRALAGLFLVGYGLLVSFRIVAHEALSAGVVSLGLGLLLLAPSLSPSRMASPSRCSSEPPQVPRSHTRLLAGLGAAIAASLVMYNLLVGSRLSLPEWGLLLYGITLIPAASLLGSPEHGALVTKVVGWSFPLAFAPLSLFAFHALITGPAGSQAGSIADPFIHHGLTLPTSWMLEMAGTATHVEGNNIVLSTSEGTLSLGIGLVCAGIYPSIMFLGILGLHAWQEGLTPHRFAAYLLLGMGALYLANLTRLAILVKVGETWGAPTLQRVHAHLGWVFFVGFILLFWTFVLRRLEPSSG